AALGFPAAVARAVPPLVVLATARSAARFAAGTGELTRATELAHGAFSMSPIRMNLCLLLATTLGAVGLGFAGTRDTGARPLIAPAPRDAGRPPPAAAPPPAAVAKAEFEEVTVVTRPSFRSNRTRETVRVSADGTCLYEVPERPARGQIPAWPGAR